MTWLITKTKKPIKPASMLLNNLAIIPLQAKGVWRLQNSSREKAQIPPYLVSKNLSLCVYVLNFDLNHFRTGKTE